jgi:hypothetical protein
LYDLSGNLLEHVYDGFYPDECKNLILKGNKLREFAEFVDMAKLEMIDLSHNMIHRVHHYCGAFHDSLREVRLNDNKIHCVCTLNLPAGVVKKLLLANNCLTCINGLSGLDGAELLDLANNALSEFIIDDRIDRVILDGNKKLKLCSCSFASGVNKLSMRGCDIINGDHHREFFRSVSGEIDLTGNYQLQWKNSIAREGVVVKREN